MCPIMTTNDMPKVIALLNAIRGKNRDMVAKLKDELAVTLKLVMDPTKLKATWKK